MGQDYRSVAGTGYAAFNARDMDRMLDTFHGEAVIADDPGFSPNAREWRGHDEIRDYWSRYYALWDRLEVTILGVEDLPGDRLLVELLAVGTGSTSGVPIETNLAHLLTGRDGLIAEMRVFRSLDDARASLAAG